MRPTTAPEEHSYMGDYTTMMLAILKKANWSLTADTNSIDSARCWRVFRTAFWHANLGYLITH